MSVRPRERVAHLAAGVITDFGLSLLFMVKLISEKLVIDNEFWLGVPEAGFRSF
jgi:hypothetical protein